MPQGEKAKSERVSGSGNEPEQRLLLNIVSSDEATQTRTPTCTTLCLLPTYPHTSERKKEEQRHRDKTERGKETTNCRLLLCILARPDLGFSMSMGGTKKAALRANQAIPLGRQDLEGDLATAGTGRQPGFGSSSGLGAGGSWNGFGHGIDFFFCRRACQITEKPKSKTRPNPVRDEILMGGAFWRLGRGDLQRWGGGAR